MTVSLTHTFVSAVADEGDSSLVRPSNWNAEHTFLMASARLLGRTTAAAGAVEELTVGSGLSLAGGSLTAPAAGITTGSSVITSGTDTRVLFNDGGTVGEDAGLRYVKGTDTLTFGAGVVSNNGAASTPPLTLTGTIFTGGSATTTKPALLVEPTGTTSTGWSTAGTLIGANAPSGFTGKYIDLQLDGSSAFSVTGGGTGGITIIGGHQFKANGGTSAIIAVAGTNVAQFDASGPLFHASGSLIIGSSGDVILTRDAANTLALRNSTAAQRFNWYATWTDASNNEGGYVTAAAGSVTIGAFTAGTGTDNVSVRVLPAGAAAFGYATGAGGSVSQATDRTTGVTLDKATGQITTQATSLAGLAQVTFTVTNAAVAATDTIILSKVSGDVDTECWVNAVGAGSFNVTLRNNHAVDADTTAFVFNFAVIKGVTS